MKPFEILLTSTLIASGCQKENPLTSLEHAKDATSQFYLGKLLSGEECNPERPCETLVREEGDPFGPTCVLSHNLKRFGSQIMTDLLECAEDTLPLTENVDNDICEKRRAVEAWMRASIINLGIDKAPAWDFSFAEEIKKPRNIIDAGQNALTYECWYPEPPS